MAVIRRRRWAVIGVMLFVVSAASCKRRPPPPERIADVDGAVMGAAADATHVYFLVWNNPRAYVARLPIGGTTIEVLAEDDESPRSIALTADTIYWTTEQNLKRIPKSGGKPVLFAAHVQPAIAVDDREIYSFEIQPSGKFRILARELAGTGSPSRTVVEEAHGSSIAVDSEAVYTAGDWPASPVERIPKGGGTATVLAKRRFGGPLLLAGDDVYYCDDRLNRVAKKGGEPHRVTTLGCGDQLVSSGGVVYGSTQSSASGSQGGLAGHEDGSVRSLAPGGSAQSLFDGRSASALVAAGGALYVVGRTEAHPSAAWYRLPVAK